MMDETKIDQEQELKQYVKSVYFNAMTTMVQHVSRLEEISSTKEAIEAIAVVMLNLGEISQIARLCDTKDIDFCSFHLELITSVSELAYMTAEYINSAPVIVEAQALNTLEVLSWALEELKTEEL